MTTLVDGLVADLPARARSAIVGRAEGVPLYAVETVRSLIDRDAVVAQDGRYVFVDHDHAKVDLDQLSAPTSLQTLIAARLDALTPAERRTVQDASVLGVSFRQPGLLHLADVSGYELDGALAGLVRKGVIETQNDPRSPELGQYRFLQALVREVAYSTLARKDRRTRHLAAAAHLESEGEDASGSLSGIIAQHLLDALDATGATDPERPVVAARARALLRAAAERAESLGSSLEALRAVRTSLALEPAPGPAEGTALHERGARLAYLAGEHSLCEQLSTVAIAGYEDAGDPVAVARVLGNQSRSVMSLGRMSESGELARRGLALLQDTDMEPALRLQLLRSLTGSMRFGQDVAQARDLTFELARLAEELADPEHLVAALNTLAIMLVDAGSPTAYVALMERSVSLAREGRLYSQLARALGNLAAEFYPNDLSRAAELATESVEVAQRVGESYSTETNLINAAFIWWLRGEWDRLLTELGDWLEGQAVTSSEATLHVARLRVLAARGEALDIRVELPDSEDPWEQHGKMLALALVQAGHGDVTAAAAAAAASAHATYASGEMLEDFEVGWAPVVELQLRAGALDEAEAVLALAAPLLGGRGRTLTRIEHTRLRGTIAAARDQDPEVDLRAAEGLCVAYGAPYLLARIRLELGRWLAGQGRRNEATPLLASARETFVQLRARPSEEEVDAVTAGVTAVAPVGV
jgi:hypothetical protein